MPSDRCHSFAAANLCHRNEYPGCVGARRTVSLISMAEGGLGYTTESEDGLCHRLPGARMAALGREIQAGGSDQIAEDGANRPPSRRNKQIQRINGLQGRYQLHDTRAALW